MLNTPRPRSLYPHQCYAGADEPEACAARREDYLECLHQTKEASVLSLSCILLPFFLR